MLALRGSEAKGQQVPCVGWGNKKNGQGHLLRIWPLWRQARRPMHPRPQTHHMPDVPYAALSQRLDGRTMSKRFIHQLHPAAWHIHGIPARSRSPLQPWRPEEAEGRITLCESRQAAVSFLRHNGLPDVLLGMGDDVTCPGCLEELALDVASRLSGPDAG